MLELIKNDNALLINNAATAALSASTHSHNTPSPRAGLIRRTGTLLHVARSPAQGRFCQTPAAAAAAARAHPKLRSSSTHSQYVLAFLFSLFPSTEGVRLQSKNKDE